MFASNIHVPPPARRPGYKIDPSILPFGSHPVRSNLLQANLVTLAAAAIVHWTIGQRSPPIMSRGARNLRFHATLNAGAHYRMPDKHVNQAEQDLPRICLKTARTRWPPHCSKAICQANVHTPRIKVLRGLRTVSCSVLEIKRAVQFG